MKTIKQGQIHGEKTFIGECLKCKCVVSFDRTEGREFMTTGDMHGGYPDRLYISIKCPTDGCDSDIWVEQ